MDAPPGLLQITARKKELTDIGDDGSLRQLWGEPQVAPPSVRDYNTRLWRLLERNWPSFCIWYTD